MADLDDDALSDLVDFLAHFGWTKKVWLDASADPDVHIQAIRKAIDEFGWMGGGAIVMQAREYAYFRKFGRDVLDIETNRERLKQGFMGVMFGIVVVVRREAPEYLICIVAGDGAGGFDRGRFIALDMSPQPQG